MYNLFITEKAQKQVLKLSKDDARHVREIISLCLGKYLKKPSKRCNKKLLEGSKYETYRLHVSMTYTVFYRINEEEKMVIVIEVRGINQAHSKYDLF